jgi:rare lipoprotein A
MMAAHRTLPFGTKVRVTNLKNNKCSVVEITDRGPYAHNRLIDLSHAAASALDFASAGVANVRVEVLDNLGGPDIAALSVPLPVFDVLRLFPGATSKSKLHATLEKSHSTQGEDQFEKLGDN